MSTARILRGLLKRIMIFLQTHMSYVDVKNLIDCELEEELTILMAMFMDMEIKVWLKQREEIPGVLDQYEHRITDRILHWFYTLLTAHTQRIDTLLSLQTVYSRNSKSIFDPIFRKVLSEMPNGPLSDVSYVRYMLIFKLWRERVLVAEDDASIELRDRIIANLMPVHSYTNFNSLLKSCLRQTPRSETNVAKYHMMPNNINLRKSCEDFLKKCRVPLDEINFASISLVDDELEDMLGDESNGVKELMRMIDNRKSSSTVCSSTSVDSESSNIEFVDLTVHDNEPSTKRESLSLSTPEPLVPTVIIDLTKDVDQPCHMSRKRAPSLDKSTSRTSAGARRIFRKEEEVYMASNLMNFIFMCPLKHQDELNRSQFDQKLCSLCKDPIHEHANCGSFQFATSKDSRLTPSSAKRELFNQAQTSSERIQCNSDANLTVCDKNGDRTSSVTQKLPNVLHSPNVARVPKQSNVALPCDRPLEQLEKPKQQVYPLMKEPTSLGTYSRRFSEKLDKRKLAELQKQENSISDLQFDTPSSKTTRLDNETSDYSETQMKNTASKQRSVELLSFTEKPNLPQTDPQSGRISPSTSRSQNELQPDIPSIIVPSSSDRISCSKTSRSQTDFKLDIQFEDTASSKQNLKPNPLDFSPKTIRKVILPVPRSREFENPTRQRLRISPEPRKDGMLRFTSPKELPNTSQPPLKCAMAAYNSEAVPIAQVKSDIRSDSILNKGLNAKTKFENKVIWTNNKVAETEASEKVINEAATEQNSTIELNSVSEIKNYQTFNKQFVPVAINKPQIHGIITSESKTVPEKMNVQVTEISEIETAFEQTNQQAIQVPGMNTTQAFADSDRAPEACKAMLNTSETGLVANNYNQNISVLELSSDALTDEMIISEIVQKLVTEIEIIPKNIDSIPILEIKPAATKNETHISEIETTVPENNGVLDYTSTLTDDTICLAIIQMMISEIESVQDKPIPDNTSEVTSVKLNTFEIETTISKNNCEQDIAAPDSTSLTDSMTCLEIIEMIISEIESVPNNSVLKNTPESLTNKIETVSENTPECSAEIEIVSETKNEHNLFLDNTLETENITIKGITNNQVNSDQSLVTEIISSEIVHDEVLTINKNKSEIISIEESQPVYSEENFVSEAETSNKQNSQKIPNVEQITKNAAIEITKSTENTSEIETAVDISEIVIENNVISELTENENSGISELEVEIQTEELLVHDSEVAVEVSVETEEFLVQDSEVAVEVSVETEELLMQDSEVAVEVSVETEELLVQDSEVAVEVSVETEVFDETNVEHTLHVSEEVMRSENQVTISSHEISNTIVQNTENIQIKKVNKPKFAIYSKGLGRCSLAKHGPGSFPKTRTKVKEDHTEAEEIEKSRLELPQTVENEPIPTKIDASTPKKRGRRRKAALPVETSVESTAIDATVPRRGRRKKFEEKSVEELPKLETSPSGTSRRKKAQPVHISQIKTQSDIISSVTHEQNDIATPDKSTPDSTAEVVEPATESKRRKRKQIFELLPDLPTKTNKLVEIVNKNADVEPKLKGKRTLRIICEKLSDTDLMGRTNSNRLLRLNRPPVPENPESKTLEETTISDINLEEKVSMDTSNSKRLLRINKPPVLETQTYKKVDELTKESSTTLEEKLSMDITTKPMDTKRKRGRPPKAKDKALSNSEEKNTFLEDTTPVDCLNNGTLNTNSEKRPKSIERAGFAEKQRNSVDLVIEYVAKNQCFELSEDDVPLTMRKTMKPIEPTPEILNKRPKTVDVPRKNKKQTSKLKVLQPAEIIKKFCSSMNTTPEDKIDFTPGTSQQNTADVIFKNTTQDTQTTSRNTEKRSSSGNSSKDSEEISDLSETIVQDGLDQNNFKSDLDDLILIGITVNENIETLETKYNIAEAEIQAKRNVECSENIPKPTELSDIISCDKNSSEAVLNVAKINEHCEENQQVSIPENHDLVSEVIQIPKKSVSFDLTPKICFIPKLKSMRETAKNIKVKIGNKHINLKLDTTKYQQFKQSQIASVQKLQLPLSAEYSSDFENVQQLEISNTQNIQNDSSECVTIQDHQITEKITTNEERIVEQSTIVDDSQMIEEDSSENIFAEQPFIVDDSFVIQESIEISNESTISDYTIIPEKTAAIENEESIGTENCITSELEPIDVLPHSGELKIDTPEDTESMKIDDLQVISEETMTIIESEVEISSQEFQLETISERIQSNEHPIVENVTEEEIITIDESQIIPEVTIIENEIEINSQEQQEIILTTDELLLPNVLSIAENLTEEIITTDESQIIPEDAVTVIENEIDVNLQERQEIILTTDESLIIPEDAITIIENEIDINSQDIILTTDELESPNVQTIADNLKIDTLEQIVETSQILLEETVATIENEEEINSQNDELDTIFTAEESTSVLPNVEKLKTDTSEEMLTAVDFQIIPEETVVLTDKEVAPETITIIEEEVQRNVLLSDEEQRIDTPEDIMATDHFQITSEDTERINEVKLNSDELELTTSELNAEELRRDTEEILTTEDIIAEETVVIIENEVELNSQEPEITTADLEPTNVLLNTEDITDIEEEIVLPDFQIVPIDSDFIEQTDNINIEPNSTIIEINSDDIETISVQSEEILESEAETAAKIEESVKISNEVSDEMDTEFIASVQSKESIIFEITKQEIEESTTIPVFVPAEIVETHISTTKTIDEPIQINVEPIDKHENERQFYADAVLSITEDIIESSIIEQNPSSTVNNLEQVQLNTKLKLDSSNDVIIIEDESEDSEYQHLTSIDNELKFEQIKPTEINPLQQEPNQLITDCKSKQTKEEACIIIDDSLESEYQHLVFIEGDINSDKLEKCVQTKEIESDISAQAASSLVEPKTDSRTVKPKKITKVKTKYSNRKKSENKPSKIKRGKVNRKSKIRKLSVALKKPEPIVEASNVTAAEEINSIADTDSQNKTEKFKVEKLKTIAEIFIRQLQIAQLKTQKSILVEKLKNGSSSSNCETQIETCAENEIVAQEIESTENPLNTNIDINASKINYTKSVSTMIEELFKVISDSDSSTVNTTIDSNLETSISDASKAIDTDTDPEVVSALETTGAEQLKEESKVVKLKTNGSKQIPAGNFDFDIILKTFEINKTANEKKSNDTKNKNEILNKTYYNSSESDLDDLSNSELVIDTSFESSDSENKNTDTKVQNTKLYKRYIAKVSAQKEVAIKRSYLKKGKGKSKKTKMDLVAKQIKKMQHTAQINEEIVFEEMYVALKTKKIKRNIANQIVLPAEAMHFSVPEVLENCIVINSESLKHAKEGMVKCSVNGIEKVNKKVLVRNDGMTQYLPTLPEHITNDLIVFRTPHCKAISTKAIAECELCASASSAKVATCPSPRLVSSYYGENIPTDENYRLNILAGVAFNLEPLDTSTETREVQRTRTNNICTQHRIKPGDLCMLVAFPDSIPESSIPSEDFNIIDNQTNSEQFKVQKLGSVAKPKGIELENKIQALTEQAKSAKENSYNQKSGSANERERLNDLLSTLEAMLDGENSNKTTQHSLALTEPAIPMIIPNTADLHLSPDDDDFTLTKTTPSCSLKINLKPTKMNALENGEKILSGKETKTEPKQDCPKKPNSVTSKSKSKLKSPNKSEGSFLLSKYKIFTDNKQFEINPATSTTTKPTSTSPPSYIRSTRPMRMVTNRKRKTSTDIQAPPKKKLNTEEVFDKLLEEHKKESNTLRPSPISTENSLPIQNAMPTLDDKEPEPIIEEIIPLSVTEHTNPLNPTTVEAIVENPVKEPIQQSESIIPVVSETVKNLVHMPEKVPCVELILKEATQNIEIDTLIEETEILEPVLKPEQIEVESKIELPIEVACITIANVDTHKIVKAVPEVKVFETEVTSGSNYFVTPEVEDYLEVLSKQLIIKDSTFEDMAQPCLKTEPALVETIVEENPQDRNAVVEEWFNRPDVEISYNQTIEECNLFEDISNSSEISQPTTSGVNKCDEKFYSAKHQTPDSGIVLDEDSIHQDKHYSEPDNLTDTETQEPVNYFKNLINPMPHGIQITDLSVVQPVDGSSVKCSIPLDRIMSLIPFLIKQFPEAEDKICKKRKAIDLENVQSKLRKLSPEEEIVEETVQVKKRKDSEVETNPEVTDKEWSTEEVMSPSTSTGISTPLRTKGSVKEYPECLYRITESPVPSGSCCINSPYPSDISLQEEPTFYVEGGIDLCSDFQNQYYESFDSLKEQQSIQATSNSPDDNRNVVQQSLQTGYYFVDSQFALPEYMHDENLRSLIVENNMIIDKGMVAFNMHQIQPETKPHIEEAKRASETDSQITGIVDEICRNLNSETSEYQADSDLLDVEINTDHVIKVDQTVSEVHVGVTSDTYQELDISRGPVIEEVPMETATVYTSAPVKTITTPTNQPLNLNSNSSKSDSKVIVERINFSPTHTIVNKDLTINKSKITTAAIAEDVLKKETEKNAEASIPKPVTSFSYIRAKNKDRKSNAKQDNDMCLLDPTDSKNSRQKSASKSSPKPSSYALSPRLIYKKLIETKEKEFKINPDSNTQNQKSFGQKIVLNSSPKPSNDIPKSVNIKPIESKSKEFKTNADAKIPIQKSYGQKLNEEKPQRRNIDYEFDQLLASGNQKQIENPKPSFEYNKYSTEQLPNRRYAESKIQIKKPYLQKLDKRPIRRNTDYEFDQLLASENQQKFENPKPRYDYNSSELFESKHHLDRRPSNSGSAHLKRYSNEKGHVYNGRYQQEREPQRYTPRAVGNSRCSPSTRRDVPVAQLPYRSPRSEPMYHLQKIDQNNAAGNQNPSEPSKKIIEEKLWLSDQKLTELVKQAHIYYSKKC